MKLIQVQLKSTKANELLTTWVEHRPGVKVGNSLTLEAFPDVLWDILFVGSVESDYQALALHRKWDNNI